MKIEIDLELIVLTLTHDEFKILQKIAGFGSEEMYGLDKEFTDEDMDKFNEQLQKIHI